MFTKEKKPPKISMTPRRATAHRHVSPCEPTARALPGDNHLRRSMDISVADFEDPDGELPARGIDRIRAILGFRRGASLPRVNTETIREFYRYLARHAALPCEAHYCSDTAGAITPVTVTGLVDPEAMPFDNRVGLYCVANCGDGVDFLPLIDIEVDEDSANFQLFEDYWFWLWNWREDHPYRPSNPR